MIDIEKLAAAFVEHARTCRSAPIVCSVHVALESWFRVEIIPALQDSGVSPEYVSFKYTYPGTRKKADLLVETPTYTTVIEIKSLVRGADAQKLKDFPNQIERLQSLVEGKLITQGIAFCTFMGYSEDKLGSLVKKFFGEPWQSSVPRPVVNGFPLKFTIAYC